jgi:hypothetical protein
MTPLWIEGMQGMGDNLYQRPIVEMWRERETGPIYLTTSWPEFYEGVQDLRFVRPNTALRTQNKNVRRYTNWAEPPQNFRKQRISYVQYQNSGMALYRGLLESTGFGSKQSLYHLSLPVRKDEEDIPRENFALIRPPTVRLEWAAYSRNPKMEYINAAIEMLNEKGLKTIVLADIQPPDEVYAEGRPPRNASKYLDHGEIKPSDLPWMFRSARLVLGGVGFIVPMSIATGTPAVIVHGGAGGWNAPELINAPGDEQPIHVLPEKYCRCRDHVHKCDKTIDLWKLRTAIDLALKRTE